uniref:Uncharacterized protein n=1 Tax=Pfiesteria piscicida TaxID=71001 RepID=E8Z6A4_PFIPI|nr:unknown [Pfiesteria piscicida]
MSRSSTGYSLQSVAIIAGACSIATSAAALLLARRWSHSLHHELQELQRRWTALQHTVASLPVDDTGFALAVGSHVVVKEIGEVTNSSLWDATNTQFCDRTGVVVSIDDDGDATVRLDSGEELICDVKFLVAAVTSDLKANMAAMQCAVRELSSAVGRGAPPVAFEP